MLRRAPISELQIAGYGVALVGVCWYHYQKAMSVDKEPSEMDAQLPLRHGSDMNDIQPLLVDEANINNELSVG